MPAGATYEPIATSTLGSDSNYITFSSISGYTDIVAVLNVRSTTASNFSDNYVRLATGGGGVDTGTNYSYTRLVGDGTSPTSSRTTSQTQLVGGIIPANNAGANVFGLCILHFMSYTGSTNKTVLTNCASDNNGSGYAIRDVALWRNTGAITSIQFFTNGNYKTGSTFTLYGIKAA